MYRITVVSLLLLSIVAVSNAQDRHEPSFPDVAYGEAYSQKVDVYLPEEAEGLLPTILLLHGNGYTKWDMEPLAMYFVDLGYAAVTVEFRNRYFVEDIFCALAWAHNDAEIYEFDVSRLVVLGHSMGGLGAILLGVTDDVEPWMQECSYTIPKTDRLQGVVLYAAAFDEEAIVSQLDGTEPPFLVLHGLNDTRVRASHAEDFATVLEGAHVDVTLVLMPEVGHFFTNPQSEPGAIAIEHVEVFLEVLFDRDTTSDSG